MNFTQIYTGLKMFYQLIIYILSFVSFFLNIVWLCCSLASVGIPWITLLLIVICVSSKFVKLRGPNNKLVIELLGPDPNSEHDSTNCMYWAVANRGGAFDAPENSVAALQQVIITSSLFYNY